MANWDFAGDEGFFFFASGAVTVVGTARWYYTIVSATGIGDSGRRRNLLALTPPVALLGLLAVLNLWADPKYVVGHIDYIMLFLAGGAMWLWLTLWWFHVFGLDWRTDVLDRRNDAAAVAVCGAMLGVMTIYAACNVGAGPTIWTTILPALVATIVWLVLWFFVEVLGNVSEQIAIERDVAAGWRLAGWLLAAGLVLGRAMAGDWTSWESTFVEFARLGWPAVLLAVVVIVLNRVMRPTPSSPARPVFSHGIVPAVALVLAALVYLVSLGPADIGKHVITYEQYTGQE